MSVVLALDTSTEACSAAVLTQDGLFAEYEVCPREHNKKILGMVDSCLQRAEIKLADVDCIAFGRGPGSFTGVRIATGVVQGLAYGANKPVVGVSSLLAMAYSAFKKTGHANVISAIDARMSEIYCAAYHFGSNEEISLLQAEMVCPPAQALISLPKQEWVGVGTGFDTYLNELQQQQTISIFEQYKFPRAKEIAQLALKDWLAGRATDASNAQPLYVRDEVTWQKLPHKQ